MTRRPATCDTSVLVAALTGWHPYHDIAKGALRVRVQSIPAHVLLECYSVLTRLPAPHRITASVAGQLLGALDLALVGLPSENQRALVQRLAATGRGGGAVYDALVAATALHHQVTLLSLDVRARSIYDVVGVKYELL